MRQPFEDLPAGDVGVGPPKMVNAPDMPDTALDVTSLWMLSVQSSGKDDVYWRNLEPNLSMTQLKTVCLLV
jgi:hypothetical protein